MIDQTKIKNVSITTERLSLREFEDDKADYENMYQLESIPEVVRYQEWPPRSRDESRIVVDDILRNRAKEPRTHVEMPVISKHDNLFTGRIGASISPDTSPPQASLWYAFLPQSHGQGYAFEAMAVLLDLLVAAGVKKLHIECDPRNSGSRKLAERLGFTKIKEIERAWECKDEWVGSVEYVTIFD